MMIRGEGISGVSLSFPDVADNAAGTSPTVLLTRLSRQVYRRASEGLLGMKLKSFGTLAYLRDQGAIGQQNLGEQLCVDANALVLILNDLEANGFAERRRDPADRRRHIVQATPEGLAALARAETYIASIEDDVLSALDAEQRATLQELLAAALQGNAAVPA
jgi:DNA-binding MarR family transcriptional regulator